MKMPKPSLTRVSLALLTISFVGGVQYLAYQAGRRAERRETVATLDLLLNGPTAAPMDIDSPEVTIVAVDSRIMETNSVWWKYAWILTLQNETGKTLGLKAQIEWLDADGFVIDHDTEYDLVIKPGAQGVFRGESLITSSVARNVSSITASVYRQ